MKKISQFLNQKGQALVLYALLASLLFTAGGAAVNLGWYYMNASRLQNSADAAALAGAQVLNEENDGISVLVKNYPDNVSDDISEGAEDKKISADKRANDFLSKNKNSVEISSKKFSLLQNDENLYYVVELEVNNFEHLFRIFNDWGKDKISVYAVAKLEAPEEYPPPTEPPQPPPPEELEEELPKLKATSVISGNWEVEDAKLHNRWTKPTDENLLKNYYIQNALHMYDKNKVWLNYNSPDNIYNTGDCYRYAVVEVKPGNGRLRTGGNSNNTTPDSLTFGFRQDLIRVLPGALEIKNGKVEKIKDKTVTDTVFVEDWDIRHDTPYNRQTEVRYIHQNGDSKYWDSSCDLRIHNIYNLYNFDVRKNKITDENPEDILWVRIESEAFIPLQWFGVSGKDKHFEFKSVRQIVLNVVEDNTIKNADGKYKYRPMVMFYDGPEKIDMNSTIRQPRPIIINLNANFRGAIFAPTAPVILNGNGYTFHGFIVAKEYRRLDHSGAQKVHYNRNIYVDKDGEVQSNRLSSRRKWGEYDTFNIGSFDDYGYEVEEDSQNNLFVYGGSQDSD